MATESKMALWRAAIALAWADHELQESEQKQLREFFDKNVDLTPEQRELLHQSIEKKVDISEIWSAVTDKQDRAHLINIAPVIFWNDNAFSHSEQEVYDRLCKDHEATLDLKQDMAEAQKMAVQFRVQWEKEAQEYKELRSRTGTIGWVMYQLGKLHS